MIDIGAVSEGNEKVEQIGAINEQSSSGRLELLQYSFIPLVYMKKFSN